ncbi:MoaC-domain-containing protein [Aspergillus piperis CBS 112811]|uniref:cyclic pyranopterin monophosphate synthase n=1 Tax=Aspergillus piperis CBS 112811 TaxID=1448313 RepID=A0A8G1R4V1_9EURO|nr:MoaC-domain-containing protein [Aspergillus piperis CBS 112811]RAH57780.1 MoaC-domain-containing protein [Aspergillus piperis CBS 112811]
MTKLLWRSQGAAPLLSSLRCPRNYSTHHAARLASCNPILLIDNPSLRSQHSSNYKPTPSIPRQTPGQRIPRSYLPQLRHHHTLRANNNNESSTTTTTNNTTKPISLPTTPDPDLPHLNASQNVHMTKITEKPITSRLATATCHIQFSNPRPWEILRDGGMTKKGDVYSVARIAGIMAAKRTPDIIPLCHPGIGITGVEVDVELVGPEAASAKHGDDSGKWEFRHGGMRVVASVSCEGRTGVEMEAMTATMGAALTVYDMLKAVDKGMVVEGVRLLEKKGGKSGHWVREGSTSSSRGGSEK